MRKTKLPPYPRPSAPAPAPAPAPDPHLQVGIAAGWTDAAELAMRLARNGQDGEAIAAALVGCADAAIRRCIAPKEAHEDDCAPAARGGRS